MRRQEMHNTRGRLKKRAEDTEKEEGGQEQEIDVVTDSEMEQQTGDKEETEVVMDTEKEIIEEDAQGDQPDKSAQKEDTSMQEMLRIIPVSYTHLDVYKRQK